MSCRVLRPKLATIAAYIAVHQVALRQLRTDVGSHGELLAKLALAVKTLSQQVSKAGVDLQRPLEDGYKTVKEALLSVINVVRSRVLWLRRHHCLVVVLRFQCLFLLPRVTVACRFRRLIRIARMRSTT